MRIFNKRTPGFGHSKTPQYDGDHRIAISVQIHNFLFRRATLLGKERVEKLANQMKVFFKCLTMIGCMLSSDKGYLAKKKKIYLLECIKNSISMYVKMSL